MGSVSHVNAHLSPETVPCSAGGELEVVPIDSWLIILACRASQYELQPLFAVGIQSTQHSGGLVLSHILGVEQ